MEGNVNVVALQIGFERARGVEDLVALLLAPALVEDEGPSRENHLLLAHRTILTVRPV